MKLSKTPTTKVTTHARAFGERGSTVGAEISESDVFGQQKLSMRRGVLVQFNKRPRAYKIIK